MSRGVKKFLQSAVIIVVVVILLCGIYSIAKRLTGTSSTAAFSTGNKEEQAAEATTETPVDNSIPMTELTVTAPEPTIRVGDTMQLAISYEPQDATNTALKWTCSEEGLVEVSEDGVLTPSEDSAKNTVEVTAEATDGSGLSVTFTLRIFEEIDPSRPMVAITMDDGPYPETTEQILDVFEEYYAKATFFCLGQNTEYYPETVQREYNLGMEVGTHTYSHVQLTKLGSSELEDEIKKSVKALKKAIGVKPSLMRPPYGSVNSEVLEAVGDQGLCCVNWSLDTEDWKTKNADATYSMVMTATDGDVVLLHDIHDYNIEAVQRFVPDLIEAGYQLVTVSEMYEARGETLDPGTIHYRTDPTTEASSETEAADSEDGAETTTSSDAEDSSSAEDTAE